MIVGYTKWKLASNLEEAYALQISRQMMKAAKTTLTADLTHEEKLALGRDIWGHKDNHRAQGTGGNEWHIPRKVSVLTLS